MRTVLAAVMRRSVATKAFAHSLAIAKRVTVVTAAGALLAAVLPVLQSSTALAGTENPRSYETPCAITCFLVNGVGLGIIGTHIGSKLTGSGKDADDYQWVDEDDEIWGLMKTGNNCWVESGGSVYIENCTAGDHYEWFAFESCPKDQTSDEPRG
jgi:hypothetical protein